MPNTISAKKAVRVSERRAIINRIRRSRIRTFIKNAFGEIEKKDEGKAKIAVRKAETEIARGAQKGIMHKNTARRKISQLAKNLNKAFAH